MRLNLYFRWRLLKARMNLLPNEKHQQHQIKVQEVTYVMNVDEHSKVCLA